MNACTADCGYCGRCTAGDGERLVPCKRCRRPVPQAPNVPIWYTVLCSPCQREAQTVQDRQRHQRRAPLALFEQTFAEVWSDEALDAYFQSLKQHSIR